MTPASRTVGTQLAIAERRLAAAGVDSPRVDAEWLLADVLGVRRATLWTDPDRPLDDVSVARYGTVVGRREAREPLQQITGWQDFHGLRLRVTPDVLVPRPETELLVDWALEFLPRGGVGVRSRRPLDGRGEPEGDGHVGAPHVVIDLGTGSGCIACAIAVERPDTTVIAVDASPRAAALARANAGALGLSRVRVAASDLFAGLGSVRADAIVSNPPYLPTGLIPMLDPEVSRHDPRQALDGGPDGLDVIRRIVAESAGRLVRGGALLLETAGGAQAGRVAALLRDAGLSGVGTRRDLAGVERFVAGRRA